MQRGSDFVIGGVYSQNFVATSLDAQIVWYGLVSFFRDYNCCSVSSELYHLEYRWTGNKSFVLSPDPSLFSPDLNKKLLLCKIQFLMLCDPRNCRFSTSYELGYSITVCCCFVWKPGFLG